jgi:hypothetical protein
VSAQGRAWVRGWRLGRISRAPGRLMSQARPGLQVLGSAGGPPGYSARVGESRRKGRERAGGREMGEGEAGGGDGCQGGTRAGVRGGSRAWLMGQMGRFGQTRLGFFLFLFRIYNIYIYCRKQTLKIILTQINICFVEEYCFRKDSLFK